jgi:TonB family protein
MGTLLVYFIKAACCLAVFYLFYKWLLSKETFHHFNRFVLLSLLFIAAALPFVQISLHTSATQPRLVVGNLMMQVVNDTNDTPSFQWQWILLIVYLLGIVFYAIKTITAYSSLYLKVHRLHSIPLTDDTHIRLILIDKETTPFSWMKYIVLSKSDYQENGKAIISHEMAHIHYFHSLDILIADICIMFQWFNPAAWLIKKELQNIHEFEADEAVIKAGIDAKNYQLLLIKKAVGTRLYSMANSLNHSSLKKRITMMLKEKSNPWARLKYVYVLPLAAISIAAFASNEVSNPLERLSDAKVSDLSAYLNQKVDNSILSPDDSSINLQDLQKPKKKTVKAHNTADESVVYNMADQQPAYPGGTSALINDISKNMRYPADALKKNIQGRVIVQFVVGTDGVVRDAKVVRSIPGLDEEALRIVNSMPRWIPGMNKGKKVAVKYTLPLTFKQTNDSKTNVPSSATSGKVFDLPEEQPEFVGGSGKMLEFFSSHLRYPESAHKAGIEGRVIVQFVVGKDGSISGAKVVRGLTEDLDNEALRVINLMPRWKPGKLRGEDVAVKFTVPFNFRLNGATATSTEKK